MEPRQVAAGRGPRTFGAPRTQAGPAGFHLTAGFDRTALRAADPARARSALACAAFAACAVGLLGVEGGVVWIVGGVWTLRVLSGDEPGVAWGIACAGAAMRWGALGLGDVQVATRLLGASVLSGAIAVRVGLLVALAAALVSESTIDGLRARTVPQQAAAGVAILALVPLFLIRGGTSLAIPRWIVASAAIAAIVAFAPPYLRRVPRWAPPIAAAVGVIVATVAR